MFVKAMAFIKKYNTASLILLMKYNSIIYYFTQQKGKIIMNAIKKVIAIISIFVLIFNLSISSFASEGTTDYDELFKKAESIDGADAERYADEISALFDSAPEAFLSELSHQSDETIERIAFFLAYGHYSTGFDIYGAFLNNYIPSNTGEQVVLEKLLGAIVG